MQLNLIFQYLYLLCIIGGIGAGVIALVRARRHIKHSGGKSFVAMLLALTEVNIIFLAQNLSTSDPGIVWTRLEYLGVAFFGVTFLTFVIEFIGKGQWLTYRILALIGAIPVITQVVLWSGLDREIFFLSRTFARLEMVSVEKVQLTGWYYVHFVYAIIAISAGFVFLISSTNSPQSPYVRQPLILIVGTTFNASLAAYSGLFPTIVKLNLTPVGVFFEIVLVSWVFFDSQISSLIPIANDTIFRSLSDAVLVINNQHQIMQMNLEAEKVFGTQSKAMLGKRLDAVPIFTKISTSLFSVPPPMLEISLETAPVPQSFRIKATPLLDRHRRSVGWVVTFHDITERKHIEDSLRASEARLRYLLANSPVSIMSNSIPPTPEAAFFSDNSRLVTGHPKEVYTDWGQWLTKIHPEDQHKIAQAAGELANHLRFTTEYRFLHGDGTYHWLHIEQQQLPDETGDGASVVGYAIDITARKQVEEALRASEERYRLLIELAPVALVVLDITERKILFINTATLQLLSNSSDQVIQSLHSWLRTSFVTELIDLAQQYQDRPNVPFKREYSVRLLNNQEIHLTAQAVVTQYLGHTALLIAIDNVTDSANAIRAEAEQRQFVEALLDISAAVNNSAQIEDVVNQVLASLSRVISFSWANVALVEDGYARTIGYRGYAAPEAEIMKNVCLPIKETPTLKYLVETQQPIIINDVNTSSLWTHVVPLPIRAYMGVPIVHRNQVIGVINLDSVTPDVFQAREAMRLQAFATPIGIVLQNALMFARAQEEASAAERQRLARDLHDSVSQTLFSISVTAETLPVFMNSDLAFVRQGLDKLTKLARGALAEMRTLLNELRPTTLWEADFGVLVTYLVNSLKARIDGNVNAVIEGDYSPSPNEVKINLYRITQEAISNIVKHSKARNIDVLIRYSREDASVVVNDDGIGFELANVSPERLGIRMMRERAAASGMSLNIESTAGLGTSVELVWRAT